MQEECFGEGPFIFRLNDTGTGPHLLTQVRIKFKLILHKFIAKILKKQLLSFVLNVFTSE